MLTKAASIPENVLNGAEINIADLVTTLGNDQFINPFIGQRSVRGCSAMTICWSMIVVQAHARLKIPSADILALQGG